MQPHLALTLGDPAGIGSEVLLKALADLDIRQLCSITIVGNRRLLEQAYAALRLKTTEPLADPGNLEVFDPMGDLDETIYWGQGSAFTGDLGFRYLNGAIYATLEGKFSGIVTAPIAKNFWHEAGHHYPGQTEVLAQKTNSDRYGMAFIGRSPYTGWTLRSLLATTHIPLADVPQTLTPELMDLKLGLLLESLDNDFGIKNPRVAIAGLNPHSGENGQLGREEKDWLNDWLDAARLKYPQATLTGLHPPDTMWVKTGKAWYGKPNFEAGADGYLALYHDQGLIPVKLMAFDYAINTTVGLPFIRTSPDHGTAFDIAGQGIANPTSMKEAIRLAAHISQCRLEDSASSKPQVIC
ncbi:4-hydroxythreonine-4-phosphate dehydrogenase PdxA [[Limnothrix rosea] IAM M-220]|uniref:4-hydroxythreonine-4-phosphate dehydrogenase PdxA n=1 Tax=[Limnothrix rosea] IAM M-220 TaxID=454133 RepID=UPI000A018D67|nr:4-hydroxythreonine-4-phosphate dehydrogenase PdxA [[Limnothrix rosea] IAM M-220]